MAAPDTTPQSAIAWPYFSSVMPPYYQELIESGYRLLVLLGMGLLKTIKDCQGGDVDLYFDSLTTF